MERYFLTTVKVNIKGKHEPDENGYYKLNMGGAELYNEAGNYYPMNNLVEKALSAVKRKISGGYLKGEMEHPRKTSGMTLNDFKERFRRVDPTRGCIHIKDLEVIKQDDGKFVFVGTVKPIEPYGHIVKNGLENELMNVALSIRVITKHAMISGVLNKMLVDIVTWDFVEEPGIAVANKFDTTAEDFGSPKCTCSDDDICEISVTSDDEFDVESFSDSKELTLNGLVEVIVTSW